MPQIVFYGVGAIMTGLLNANRRFGVPMFAPILNNLTVIAVVLAFHVLVGGRLPGLAGVTAGQRLLLGLGTTAGVVAMTMVQWPFLRRIGFRFRPVLDLRDPAIRKMAKLSAYTIGYVVTNQLGYLVIPILANSVTGGYTAYTYAFTFFQLPHGVFAVSIITALLPRMSEYAVARAWPAFRAAVSQGIRLTALVLLPATIGYVVLARPILRLLVVHGVVHRGGASELLLVRVLIVFVIGLLPFSAFQLILRAYYALQDTRTPLLVNLVSTGTQAVLDIVLFWLLPYDWKVAGLAVGHGAGYAVGSVLLLVLLSRRIGGLDGARVLGAVARMLLAGTLMGLAAAEVARTVQRLLAAGFLTDLVTVASSVLAGLVIYLAAAALLRVRELRLLLGLVQRRGAPADS
jgi:putative peptidoglycan lipid II flippase